MITFRQLLAQLSTLSDDELDSTATVEVADDEFCPVCVGLQRLGDDSSAMDAKHPFIRLLEPENG